MAGRMAGLMANAAQRDTQRQMRRSDAQRRRGGAEKEEAVDGATWRAVGGSVVGDAGGPRMSPVEGAPKWCSRVGTYISI